MKRKSVLLFLVLTFLLGACSAPPTEPPGFILTMVASTQTVAAYLTEMAEADFTQTPTPIELRATITPPPTQTGFVYLMTPSSTLTPLPSLTPTPSMRTEWPDWKTGEVVRLSSGSGANIGTNKKFSDLTGLMVKVVRRNGVALRPVPNKAIGGPMEEEGSAFTLTGIMNKNPEFVWLFVQVIASDGNTYWVGGSAGDQNTDPRFALEFYYPKLTPSPTPGPSPTPTITLSPTVTVTPSPTFTPRP